MKRVKWNALVDALAGITFVLLMSTGAVMGGVLPPRSGRDELLGLTRHQWGNLHLVLAIILIVLLSVHVILHWGWIVAMVRGKPKSGASAPSGGRLVLGAASLVALLTIALVPLFTPVQPSASPRDDSRRAFDWINGASTLADIEQRAGVDSPRLLSALALPADLPASTRLSTIHADHGIPVHTVRYVVRGLAGDAEGDNEGQPAAGRRNRP